MERVVYICISKQTRAIACCIYRLVGRGDNKVLQVVYIGHAVYRCSSHFHRRELICLLNQVSA